MPMAFRLEVQIIKTNNQDNEWVDRLIASLYIAISCSAISILIAMLFGIDA